MQNLLFSLNATMPVFFVMVVGYLLGQTGFLPPAFCKAADKLCFKVTLPVMLFLDMGSVDILHDFQPRFVLFCFAATLVGILAVWADPVPWKGHAPCQSGPYALHSRRGKS